MKLSTHVEQDILFEKNDVIIYLHASIIEDGDD